MKTNVESLKALYVKLGGNLTDYYSDIAGGIPVAEYDLISDCIQAVSKKASSGGGSDLPEPGADGNVLTADDGEWVSAAPSGGEYRVDLLKLSDTCQSNRTVAEVISAINSGKTVVAYYAPGSQQPAFRLDRVTKIEDAIVIFSGTYYDFERFYDSYGQHTITAVGITEHDEEVWLVDELKIPQPSGDGKILGVDDGEYKLIANTAPYMIHLKTLGDGQGNNVLQTTESAGDIEAAAINGKSLCAVLIPGGGVAYVYMFVESFSKNIDAEHGTVDYEMKLSYWNDSAQGVREYITLESTSSTYPLVGTIV